MRKVRAEVMDTVTTTTSEEGPSVTQTTIDTPAVPATTITPEQIAALLAHVQGGVVDKGPARREQRPLRPIEGTVVRVNTRSAGVLLESNDFPKGAWFNVTKFANVPLPPIDARVRLHVDDKDWIRKIDILDAPALGAPVQAAIAAPPRRTELRIVALQAAASFGSGQDWATSVVLETADRFLVWLQQEAA